MSISPRTRSTLLALATVLALTACGAPARPGAGAPQAVSAEAFGKRASHRAFVANERSGTVSVIDTGRAKRIGTIDVGSKPSSLALTPDGSKLLVANRGGNALSIFDAEDFSRLATIRTSQGPAGVAISPGGTYAVVACAGDGVLDIISLQEKTVTNRVTVGREPVAVAISPEGDFVYVANAGEGTVTKIDFETEKVVATFDAGKRPVALAMKNGERLYVANEGDNTISAISTVTGETAVSIKTGGGFLTGGSRPAQLALNPKGPELFVANTGKRNVGVIDTTRNAIAGQISLSAAPGGIGVTPDGRYALIAQEDGFAALVNLRSRQVLRTRMPVGLAPSAVVIAANEQS